MRLPTIAEVRHRLMIVFPEGVADRSKLTRELAAKTVATFLFVNAVGDPDTAGTPLLRPSMVTWMDDSSLARADDAEFVRGWHSAASRRQSTLREFLRSHGMDWQQWYADNSRESIRDEVIRPLSERYDAVLRRQRVSTNDKSPALTLAADFAALFEPGIEEEEVEHRAEAWRSAHLGAAERARLDALRRLDAREDAVTVSLPGRGERQLPAGLSSVLTASVIAELAPRLAAQPYVLAICHARDPVAGEDARELERVGLSLDASVALPDVLLLDAANTTFWFIEVVVSGGPVHERRRAELLRWARNKGIPEEACRLLTAYRSRSDAVFRTTVGVLAWNTQAWFADEPDRIFRLDELEPNE